jgi:ferredoxin
MPKVDTRTMASTHAKVFFGGDSAFGPKNIIWAVAHGHEAAISIDRLCRGEDINVRPPPQLAVSSQKMGIHEWSYDNEITLDKRYRVPHRDKVISLRDIKAEVELGYDPDLALKEAERCLNCDVQTVFTGQLCIECDACVDICPMDCITFTANGEEAELRGRLQAPAKNLTQDLYIGNSLKTGRVMVKDEDVCLHCGLCAERCPTGAWDMQKYLIDMTHAEQACQSKTSTARVPRAPTNYLPAPCCAWACRSRRAISFRPTSKACRPGTKCASRKPAISARAAAPILWSP